MKDLFTKEIEQKAEALVAKYEDIVKIVQSHFEDSVLHESLKTGQKIDQISKNIKQYAAISSELIDAVQLQTLLYELDRQQDRIVYPESYKLHFNSLNDRLNKIVRDRKGRLPVAWLHKEEAYQNWKNNLSKTKFLCLRAPRGHGKSVAMTSARREIIGEIPEPSIADNPPEERPQVLVCHFFYKKGEQDIQSARAGMEAILHQLLSSKHLRQAAKSLVAALEVLNPRFGEGDSGKETGDFMESVESLCNAIRRITEAIPSSVRIYIMMDALDECIDRREKSLTQQLRRITQDGPENIRIIISARDNFDLIGELVKENPDIVKGADQQIDTKFGEEAEIREKLFAPTMSESLTLLQRRTL
ncbi:hypothetical protein ABW20_dc0106288 [Dactylellina cionopaga]|nr:hypothetical protein ABW20_dc0106288 [Dactylellina cionopaga]